MCGAKSTLLKVNIALRIEDDMLYTLLLAFFLIQFLVILGVIVFAILFSRPEVPLKGDGGLERTAVGAGSEWALRQRATTPREIEASSDSHTRMSQLRAVRHTAFATLSILPEGGRHQGEVQRLPWSSNN